MAVEKGKVLAKFELILKGKSLSKNFKDSLAAKWAEKIETDEDIDAYVEDRQDVLIEASAEADRVRTAAKKVEVKVEEPEEVKLDDAPEWAKSLIKQNQELASKFEQIESAKKFESISDKFKKDERLKGIPEFAFKGRIPKSEEEYEDAVSELSNDFKEFATKAKLEDYGNDQPTGGAGKAKLEVKKITAEDAAKIIQN